MIQVCDENGDCLFDREIVAHATHYDPGCIERLFGPLEDCYEGEGEEVSIRIVTSEGKTPITSAFEAAFGADARSLVEGLVMKRCRAENHAAREQAAVESHLSKRED